MPHRFFGLATNIIVSSMLMTGGSATVTDLTGMPTRKPFQPVNRSRAGVHEADLENSAEAACMLSELVCFAGNHTLPSADISLPSPCRSRGLRAHWRHAFVSFGRLLAHDCPLRHYVS